MLISLLTVFFCLIIIWFFSGIVVHGVEQLSRRLNLSRFAVSVFLLGFITSLPEIGVLINSLVLDSPEVSLGNLVGGQMFLLFFIIPLLAVLIGKIQLHTALQGKSLIITLLVLAAPLIASLDRQISRTDALVLLCLYAIFTLVYWQKMSLLERVEKRLSHHKKGDGRMLLKVVISMGFVLLASNRLVSQIHTLSTALGLHEFFVSMVVIAIGTNTPELSLMIRGIFARKSDVALGNYIGSATLNTLLMTILVMARGGAVIIHMEVIILTIFIVGIACFWYFSRSKGSLSRSEGFALLGIYFLFIAVGLFQEITL